MDRTGEAGEATTLQIAKREVERRVRHNVEPCDERDNWTVDRQAELMMAGLSEADALRRALEDWHTYKVPNTNNEGTPAPLDSPCL